MTIEERAQQLFSNQSRIHFYSGDPNIIDSTYQPKTLLECRVEAIIEFLDKKL